MKHSGREIEKYSKMGKKGKSKEELTKELDDLRQTFDSLKDSNESKIKGLILSEEKFRKAYMTSPDSININRLSDGMYVSVNKVFTRLMGYTEEEIIGKTSLEMNIWVNPDDRSNLAKELKLNGAVENFEAEFCSKNGKIILGSMSASLIELDGEPHILNVTRDITSRRQAEDALDKERSYIDALMNNLPDHIYFKDTESRFVRNSRSHVRSFGLNDPGQVVGKSDFDFFTEQAATEAYEDEQRIMKTGEPMIKEEKLTRKDGSVVWFSAMKLPQYDKRGNILGTFGISRDITEKKIAEEAVKQSEERYRSVTMSANDAIITVDSKEIITGWNRSAERIFGYTEKEIIGKSLNLLIAEEFRAQQSRAIKLLKMGSGKYMTGKPVELKGVNKNGSVFPAELSFSEWKTAEDQFFTGIVRDITSRKRTELENQIIYEVTRGVTSTANLDELLKLIHQMLGKAVDAENCFIALHNHKTGLFSFPYFVDRYDPMPAPTSMGKSCTAYVYRTAKPLLLTEEVFSRLLEQNEVVLVGSPSPSWIGIPLQTPSEIIGVLVLQNYEKENVFSEKDMNFLVSVGSQIAIVIERKKTEEEIRLKNELLLALNAEKDKFFSILAHDLRGPMSAFVAATQLLTEDIQNVTLDEIRGITMSLKTDATNIYRLLENLLEWSRLQRGVMEFKPERINLKNSINAAVEVVSDYAKKKGITVALIMEDNMEVVADRHMFETIVRNLASNAVKFTQAGGKVTVSSYMNQDHNIEIRITDTGIGMTPGLKSRLFMLNEKTSRKGTEGEPSSGLGLLLCKEFIEKHEGSIWVESEEGKGSTFAFSIPDRKL
jgi:PAS domain S-box-containing protein